MLRDVAFPGRVAVMRVSPSLNPRRACADSVAAFGLLLFSGIVPLATAQEFIYKSGTNAWDAPSNWTPSVIPDSPDVLISFQKATETRPVVEIDATDRTVGSISADLSGGGASGGWTIRNVSGKTGKLIFDSASGTPSITTTASAAFQSLSLEVSLSGTKGIDIYGTAVDGSTYGGGIIFTGNNTGLTGGFNFRSTVMGIYRFNAPAAAGSNAFNIYSTAGTRLLLGGSGAQSFSNNANLATGTKVEISPNSSGDVTYSGVISGSGDVTFSSYGTGGLKLTGINTHTGKTMVNGPLKLTFNSAANFGNGSTLQFAASGGSPTLIHAAGNTADITKKADQLSTRTVDLYTAQLAVDTNGNDVTYANALAGSFASSGITKQGVGSLRLRGANTYKNLTVVEMGTLLISNSSNSGTGTSEIQVKADAILGGSGTMIPDGSKNLIVAAGGTLAPGDAGIGAAMGKLSLNLGNTTGKAIFENGSKFQMTLGLGLKSSCFVVTNALAGDISFMGTTVINFTDLSGGILENGAYTLIQSNDLAAYSGLLFEGDRIIGGLTIGSGLSEAYSAYLSLSGNDIVLNLTAVPEPGAFAFLLVALGIVAGFGCHRKLSEY